MTTVYKEQRFIGEDALTAAVYVTDLYVECDFRILGYQSWTRTLIQNREKAVREHVLNDVAELRALRSVVTNYTEAAIKALEETIA